MIVYRRARVPGGTWFFTMSLVTDKVGGAMSSGIVGEKRKDACRIA